MGLFFPAAKNLVRGISWQGRILLLAAALTLAACGPTEAEKKAAEAWAAEREAAETVWVAQATAARIGAEHAQAREIMAVAVTEMLTAEMAEITEYAWMLGAAERKAMKAAETAAKVGVEAVRVYTEYAQAEALAWEAWEAEREAAVQVAAAIEGAQALVQTAAQVVEAAEANAEAQVAADFPGKSVAATEATAKAALMQAEYAQAIAVAWEAWQAWMAARAAAEYAQAAVEN